MWTPATRRQHSREGLRYETDLTDAEWALIEPHMPKPRIRGDARPTVVGAVEIGHLVPQPREIEQTIDTGEDVIVGNELAQGNGDEEFQLIALLAPKQQPSLISRPQENQSAAHAAKGPSGLS